MLRVVIIAIINAIMIFVAILTQAFVSQHACESMAAQQMMASFEADQECWEFFDTDQVSSWANDVQYFL